MEDSKMIGIRNKIEISLIKEMISKINGSKIKIILISSCYSQLLGEFMKNQFPKAIVIAINKDQPERDEAGMFFA